MGQNIEKAFPNGRSLRLPPAPCIRYSRYSISTCQMVNEWTRLWRWAFVGYHSHDLWALGFWCREPQKGDCQTYDLSAPQGTLPFLLYHSPDHGAWSSQIVLPSPLPSFLPSAWHPHCVRIEVSLCMLNSWVCEAGSGWLTGLRSDVNPCGGTSLCIWLWSSESCSAPLAVVSPETWQSDEGRGVSLILLFILFFAMKWAFLR